MCIILSNSKSTHPQTIPKSHKINHQPQNSQNTILPNSNSETIQQKNKLPKCKQYHCLECLEAKPNECTKCQSDHYVYQNLCTFCGDKCQDCSDNLGCTKCIEKYELFKGRRPPWNVCSPMMTITRIIILILRWLVLPLLSLFLITKCISKMS